MDFVQCEGDRGHLLDQVAASCPGPHKPEKSTSKAILAEDPHGAGKLLITIVQFLLNTSLLEHLWKETGCYVKACGDVRFGFPVDLCLPYLIIMVKLGVVSTGRLKQYNVLSRTMT